MTHGTALIALLVVGAIGCSSDTGDAGASGGTAAAGSGAGGSAGGGGDSDYAYSACSVEDHVGGFSAALLQPVGGDPYSVISGRVVDGIVPELVPEEVMTVGDCTLLMGVNYFCDPDCGSDHCGPGNECVADPVGQDLGTVDISGLVDGPVSLMPRAPRNNYMATGTLSYPAFAEGAALTLTSTGGGQPALSLVAEGVAPLAVHESEVALVDGQPATVTWDPPAQSGRSHVLATLNIALHGGDPMRIECDTDDDGSLEVAAELVSQLLTFDYSGFPGITLTRQTSDSAEGPDGCIDFRVYSNIERYPVTIEGLTSCNELNPDCPTGQTCNYDRLACE